jgi:hypothetical protein
MTTTPEVIVAPRLDDAIAEYERTTTDVVRRRVRSYDVKLYRDGTVCLADGPRIQASAPAVSDLGRMVGIPGDCFLNKFNAKLRAFTFNYLLRTNGTEHPTFIAEIDGGTLTAVSTTCLVPVPRLGILQSLRASVPDFVDPSNLKVIAHGWNGLFDVSVISETLICEPRVGDTVAFGVSVAEDDNGAVQVQAASYRLLCKNGAINRICDSNDRRLRRPMWHTNRDDDYFRRVRALAADAWRKWEENAAGIQHLPAVPIYEERFPELRSTLRNAPFFLSAGLADRVLARLLTEATDNRAAPTAFDLWNALTHIGTHNDGLSQVMRFRLRRGAGELAHHSARTCSACKQICLS